jgi:tetratricopeptide (TPR) repeat protein
MKFEIFFIYFLCLIFLTSDVLSQGTPNDPNHLPQQMGNNSTDKRIDGITVSGRVVLEGFPANQERPVMYIIVYHNGRINQQQKVSDSGSYILNNVPRRNSVLAVEVEKNEVAQHQIVQSPSSSISHDFFVPWLQVRSSTGKTGVISAKDLYPRNDESQKLFDRALVAVKDKKNETAINLFKQIVKNDGKDFAAWTQLGNLYFLGEKLKEAEEAYSKAIEQKSDYLLPQLNLGKVQLAQNDSDKAIATLGNVVEAEPQSADAQHFLGEAYLQAKKGSKAVVHLNEAIRLAPLEKAALHLRLATLYNGAGLKDRAALEYKQFLVKVPKYEEKEKLEKYIRENLPQ